MTDILERLRETVIADAFDRREIVSSMLAERLIHERSDAAEEIERLRAALKEIQAYSVGDPKPRHTWYYDRAERALSNEQSRNTTEG